MIPLVIFQDMTKLPRGQRRNDTTAFRGWVLLPVTSRLTLTCVEYPFKCVYQCWFYTCERMGMQLGGLLCFRPTPSSLFVVLVIIFGVDSHYLTHLQSMDVCWRDRKKYIFNCLMPNKMSYNISLFVAFANHHSDFSIPLKLQKSIFLHQQWVTKLCVDQSKTTKNNRPNSAVPRSFTELVSDHCFGFMPHKCLSFWFSLTQLAGLISRCRRQLL